MSDNKDLNINLFPNSEERAATLVDALLNADLPEDSRRKVEAWLKSGASENAKWNCLQEIIDGLEENLSPGAEDYARYLKTKFRLGLPDAEPAPVLPLLRPLYRRSLGKVAAVAACLLVVVGGFYFFNLHKTDPAVPVLATTEIRVDDSDDSKNVLLPDGSSISVVSGKITHATDFENGRQVELTGEAYFNVERDTTRIFTVKTEHFNISVLGTEFRVKSPAGEDYSTIDLYTGSIEVEVAGKKYIMAPREHMHYDHKSGQVTIEVTPLTQVKDAELPGLVFSGSTMPFVLNVLREHYGIRVTVQDSVAFGATTITGDFSHVNSLDNLMSILQRLSGNFAYEIHDDEIIVKTNN